MEKSVSPQCAQCGSKECRDGKDCFSRAGNHKQLYQDDQIAELHKAALVIESGYYKTSFIGITNYNIWPLKNVRIKNYEFKHL